jgi:hypothetical protein
MKLAQFSLIVAHVQDTRNLVAEARNYMRSPLVGVVDVSIVEVLDAIVFIGVESAASLNPFHDFPVDCFA